MAPIEWEREQKPKNRKWKGSVMSVTGQGLTVEKGSTVEHLPCSQSCKRCVCTILFNTYTNPGGRTWSSVLTFPRQEWLATIREFGGIHGSVGFNGHALFHCPASQEGWLQTASKSYSTFDPLKLLSPFSNFWSICTFSFLSQELWFLLEITKVRQDTNTNSKQKPFLFVVWRNL